MTSPSDEPAPDGDAVYNESASDEALIDVTASVLSTPRTEPADSFILHAPLELLARAALLPIIEPGARAAARQRLGWLADSYSTWGSGVDEPIGRLASFEDVTSARESLGKALARGEPDDADGAAMWLANRLEADELASVLADPLLPLLSAAAHGSIFLYQLPRVAPRSRHASRMLRGLVRELARYPGWELSWFRGEPSSPLGTAAELAHRLTGPASPGDPGSDFIYPIMSLTEQSGLARDLLQDLTGVPVSEAKRTLLRVAAMSMLQDDPEQAPYGWTHCLTMPQATLGMARACAEPWHAVAVAATYVLGFRSVLGRVVLDLAWEPPSPDRGVPLAALDAAPDQAAAAAWHATPEERAQLRARLASRAAIHHDAHLVKYTVACFDAAHGDPEAEPLYLAAAAYLGAWWTARDGGHQGAS